jgi:hypothetical protein
VPLGAADRGGVRGGVRGRVRAWDLPPAVDGRAYTAARAPRQLNVNLAHVGRLDRESVRGRLALQAGTSVQSNYAAEPRIGSVSGPDVSRLIQEGTVGVRVATPLWLDAGVFFSHIGQESWISRDNPVYSRSLIADYTPYYSTGVRAIWQASAAVTVHLHVVNGWQIISETNDEKAAGVRVEYAPKPTLLLGYSNYVGNEQPDSVPARVRVQSVFAGWAGRPDGRLVTRIRGPGGRRRRSDAWYGAAFVVAMPSATGSPERAPQRYSDRSGDRDEPRGGGFETTGPHQVDVTPPAACCGVPARVPGDRPLYRMTPGLDRTTGFFVIAGAHALVHRAASGA